MSQVEMAGTENRPAVLIPYPQPARPEEGQRWASDALALITSFTSEGAARFGATIDTVLCALLVHERNAHRRGLDATSIGMTLGLPRETVRRRCARLVAKEYVDCETRPNRRIYIASARLVREMEQLMESLRLREAAQRRRMSA